MRSVSSSECGLEGQTRRSHGPSAGRETVLRSDRGAVVLVAAEVVDVLQVDTVLLVHVGTRRRCCSCRGPGCRRRRSARCRTGQPRRCQRRRQVDAREDLVPDRREREREARRSSWSRSRPTCPCRARRITLGHEQVAAAAYRHQCARPVRRPRWRRRTPAVLRKHAEHVDQTVGGVAARSVGLARCRDAPAAACRTLRN